MVVEASQSNSGRRVTSILHTRINIVFEFDSRTPKLFIQLYRRTTPAYQPTPGQTEHDYPIRCQKFKRIIFSSFLNFWVLLLLQKSLLLKQNSHIYVFIDFETR